MKIPKHNSGMITINGQCMAMKPQPVKADLPNLERTLIPPVTHANQPLPAPNVICYKIYLANAYVNLS